MSGFSVDTIIPLSNLCNLEEELEELFQLAKKGQRVVVFGRRNTGKTSLILNGVIPKIKSHFKKSCNVFVDFMGVETEQDAIIRLRRAVELALTQAFPIKQNLKAILDIASRLRPNFSPDPLTGELSITLNLESSSKTSHLEDLLFHLALIHKKIPVFLVFDEFQDITAVSSLTAMFRSALQRLPSDLPVFVCGSKKHILSNMFGRHKAPFAGWGRDFLIPTVESEVYIKAYAQYANVRLAENGKSLDMIAFRALVKLCDGIPESLNIVLDHLARDNKIRGKIDEPKIRIALATVIDNRRSRFEEILKRFSILEQNILIVIAKEGPILKPKGKEFLSKNSNFSPTAIFSNMKRLEEEADIYLKEDGYVVSDPLLAVYLQRFR